MGVACIETFAAREIERPISGRAEHPVQRLERAAGVYDDDGMRSPSSPASACGWPEHEYEHAEGEDAGDYEQAVAEECVQGERVRDGGPPCRPSISTDMTPRVAASKASTSWCTSPVR